MSEVRQQAAALLGEADAWRKTSGVLRLYRLAQKNLALDPAAKVTPLAPAYPQSLQLAAPTAMPKRSLFTAQGKINLLHSLAHIELNAVHIALDAVARFSGLPTQFYADWLSVARDEAYHFRLLEKRLRSLGSHYGSQSAHQGLWDITQATAYSPLARMALVPRVLEARGLDAAPAMITKLNEVGDTRSAAIVSIILRDEVGHVAIGNQWYYRLCAAQNLEPIAEFKRLAALHRAPQLKPPFNTAARAKAGFSAAEMQQFQNA